jgi:hypothetical protein
LTWVRILALVLIPLGGLLMSEFESRHDRMGLGVVFFTLAVLGMFAAVPDTEGALVLMMVTVPVALLAWPVVTGSMGSEGAYLAVAMFLWVTAAGGGGRPASIIGSVACLGLLFAEPILVRFDPTLAGLTTWLTGSPVGPVLASVPQFVVVVICSRVAARFTSEAPAIAVVILAYGAIVLWVRRSRPRVPGEATS